MKNNVRQIQELSLHHQDDIDFSINNIWELVRQRLNIVVTLNEITPKSIPRSGIAMSKAIYGLLDALNEYEKARFNK